MKTKYILGLFVIVALMQASVPLKMIYDSEITQSEGAEYKFKTQPIDPTDPFRGKYVTLSFDADEVLTKDTTWIQGEKVFVYMEKDSTGFAKIKEVSRTETDSGDYFTASVNYYTNYDKILRLNFPFNRYYMEEGKAAEAEQAYRQFSEEKNLKPAYAVVAVRNGNAVLKDVIINDIPIRDYVLKERKHRAKK